MISLIRPGKRYRDEILLPGGSREEMESLEVSVRPEISGTWVLIHLRQKFLGRKPSMDAFLKELFGSSGTANL